MCYRGIAIIGEVAATRASRRIACGTLPRAGRSVRSMVLPIVSRIAVAKTWPAMSSLERGCAVTCSLISDAGPVPWICCFTTRIDMHSPKEVCSDEPILPGVGWPGVVAPPIPSTLSPRLFERNKIVLPNALWLLFAE